MANADTAPWPKQFLDFPNISKWHTAFLVSIESQTPGKITGHDTVPGDRIISRITNGEFHQTVEVCCLPFLPSLLPPFLSNPKLTLHRNSETYRRNFAGAALGTGA